MNGEELTAAIVKATNGKTTRLATEPKWPAFAITIAPAGAVVLVRDHHHVITVSIGGRSWHVSGDEPMPADLPGQASEWARAHANETTIVDTAIAVTNALAAAMGEPWELSIPGGQHVPSEMWLAPLNDSERASVGVFKGSIHIDGAVVPVPKGRRLDATCATVVQHVRAQITEYGRALVIGESCKRLAADLAERLGLSWRMHNVVTAWLLDSQRHLATVEARDGVIYFDVGLPAERGWHGTAEAALGAIDMIKSALAAYDAAVTMDSLREGARYRLLISFEGFKKGEIVTYCGPLDNHAPHQFMRENNEEVLIDEYALRNNVDRLLVLA